MYTRRASALWKRPQNGSEAIAQMNSHCTHRVQFIALNDRLGDQDVLFRRSEQPGGICRRVVAHARHLPAEIVQRCTDISTSCGFFNRRIQLTRQERQTTRIKNVGAHDRRAQVLDDRLEPLDLTSFRGEPHASDLQRLTQFVVLDHVLPRKRRHSERSTARDDEAFGREVSRAPRALACETRRRARRSRFLRARRLAAVPTR